MPGRFVVGPAERDRERRMRCVGLVCGEIA